MANRYISDIHFGHENCIRLDSRPFENMDDMTKKITEKWNSVVADDDTVYILGDFCWEKQNQWPKYLEPLNGNLVLIRGNHDPKRLGPPARQYFEEVHDYMEVKEPDGRIVILSHYPIPFHRAAYRKFMYMLYGHVHNSREFRIVQALRDEVRNTVGDNGHHNLGQWYNCGCMLPWIDYAPRTLDEIIAGDTAWHNFELRNEIGTQDVKVKIDADAK